HSLGSKKVRLAGCGDWMTVKGRQPNRERSRDRLVTGDDGRLDYPLTRARVPPIIYFGVTTCHQAREGLHLAATTAGGVWVTTRRNSAQRELTLWKKQSMVPQSHSSAGGKSWKNGRAA